MPVDGHAYEGIYMQLKSYSKSVDKGLENKRMRWKLDEVTRTLQLQDRLAQGGALCAGLDRDYNSVEVLNDVPLRLYKCEDSPLLWDFDEQTGQLTTLFRNKKQCLVAYDCSHGPNTYFCRLYRHIPTVNFEEQVIAGSYLGLSTCTVPTANPITTSLYAQTYFRNVNCTMDCSAELLENMECDPSCNYELCEYDLGYCTRAPTFTNSPTVPSTLHPTMKITQLEEPPLPAQDVGSDISVWIVVILLLLAGCGACLVRRRSRRQRNVQVEGIDEFGSGSGFVDAFEAAPVKSSSSHSSSITETLQQKFQTSSAVALNQLRYHSRPFQATTSSRLPQEDDRQPLTENAAVPPPPPPVKFRFEESGLV